MSATPESKVKAKVTALLKQYPRLWYTTPIGASFGNPALDYIGVHMGMFFAVEVKKNTGQPTARQLHTMSRIRDAGGIVFLVNDDVSLGALRFWLEDHTT